MTLWRCPRCNHETRQPAMVVEVTHACPKRKSTERTPVALVKIEETTK